MKDLNNGPMHVARRLGRIAELSLDPFPIASCEPQRAIPRIKPGFDGPMRLALSVLGALCLYVQPAVAGHVMLGAHVGHKSSKTSRAEFSALESAIGRKLTIDSIYNDWAEFPYSARVIWDKQNGHRTMISWRVVFQSEGASLQCATAADIVAGVYDTQLARQAAAIKALGAAVLIRFNYEMTDNLENTCFTGFPVNQNPPLAGARFIAAWKHVVTLFRVAGAKNAQWVFAPSGGAYKSEYWRYFYPGAAYVDWMAADQYNKTDVPLSFATDPDILAFYAATAALGKPLMISETGANDDPLKNPDAQTRWLTTLRVFFKSKPALSALVYWDDPGQYIQQHRNYGGTGYVLSGPGLAAFKAIADDPYFQ